MKTGDVVMILRDDVPGCPHRTGFFGMLGIVTYSYGETVAVCSSNDFEGGPWSWDISELELIEEAP
jgi:hypothetical protein